MPERSATSGTRTPTTGSGPPGCSTCPSTTVNVGRGRSPTTARNDQGRRHRHPPPDAVPRARAARWSSAPAPCSGRGVWTTPNRRRPPTATCSRRRSTCSRTWACSRATLIAGLTAATASTDTTAPTSTITSPAAGRERRRRRAGDRHRHRGRHRWRVVAGVEVSTDGGTTWHPATGTTSWTLQLGRARQPDRDHQVAGGRRQRQPRDARRPVPRSTSPAPARSGAPASRPARSTPGRRRAIEVGVKFTSDVVRHGHRGPLLQGQHEHRHPRRATCGRAAGPTARHGDVHRRDRLRLAAGDLRDAGRRSTPTRPTWRPTSRRLATTAQDERYLYPHPSPGPTATARVDSPPLHALRNTGGAVNGLYAYAHDQRLPDAAPTTRANYWVDVCSRRGPAPATARPAPTGVTATPGNASAAVSWTAPADGGSAITGYTVTPYIGTTAQTPMTVHRHARRRPRATVTGLTNGTAYTFTVAATNAVGTGPASRPRTRSRPSATACTSCTIWPAPATPATASTPTPRRSSWASSSVRRRRLGHRHPLLQGRRQHRHPRRRASGRRPGTKLGVRRPSPARRPPAGSRSPSPLRSRSPPGTDLRRRPTRARPATTPVTPATSPPRASTTPPLHALPGRRRAAATASTPTARRAPSRRNSFDATNYWVDVVFASGAATAPGAPPA